VYDINLINSFVKVKVQEFITTTTQLCGNLTN
jgi:hypothetical protein